MRSPCRALPLAVAAGALALAAAASPARAQLELKWATEGYYRTRAVTLTNLAPEPRWEREHPFLDVPVVMPDIRNVSYITQRLRLNPSVAYGAIARLNMQLDAFDDVLWGDNNAVNSAPLFAVNGSNQWYLGGDQVPTVQFTRAWIEFQIPVGVMRVGRMPSHWGMGLLANGGGSGNWDPTAPTDGPPRRVGDFYFDEDFGDNHFGSTNDRILFATKPLTILRTILKKDDTRSNVMVAYAFDKLSEAPFVFAEEDRRFRPLYQQGFLARGAEQDDVNEHVFVLAYTDPDWDVVAPTDELKLGTYWVVRTQDEAFTEPSEGPPHLPDPDNPGGCMLEDGRPVDPAECVIRDEGSLIWIGDVWYRIRYGIFYSEAEYYHIGGESTGGVPYPAANIRKEASIDGGALRAGVLTPRLDGLVEVGYASGDENLGDLELTQRPVHPDHNVGLILYEEILRERSARVFGPNFFSEENPNGIRGFMSQGGVINSMYVQPKVRYRPLPGLEVVGAVLLAWLDEFSEPPNLFVCPNSSELASECTASKYLGTEIDLAVKARFADDHLDFSLESGLLFLGDPLKQQTDEPRRPIPDAPETSFSLQARIAYLF